MATPVAQAVADCKTFKPKTKAEQRLILEAISILEAVGLPLGQLAGSPRKAERIALALLALAGLAPPARWASCRDVETRSLTSRNILEWQNERYGESRSSGSYDDVRREDLKWLTLASLAVNTGKGAKNDPKRAYGLNPEFAELLRTWGSPKWGRALSAFVRSRPTLDELLTAPRRLTEYTVTFGQTGDVRVLELGPGAHNDLIKACVERFLVTFGQGAEVLYVGDADARDLFREDQRLAELGVFELTTDELPDVVAYSAAKDWLFIIEAVHSSGPVSREKHLRYRRLLTGCSSGVVYVTAFATRERFRSFLADIAWETEVWIANEPDHLIHFNGGRFLGPHPLPKDEA